MLALLFRKLRLPLLFSYLVAGIAIGPHGFGLIQDLQQLQRLGEIGIILLLFFLGLEMSLPRLARNWRVALLGTR